MDKAIWVEDYDYKTDSIYTAVGCPYCEERLLKGDEGYYCPCCGNDIEVDDKDMIKWLEDREETKVELGECHKELGGCGGKDTSETHYRRNPVTMKWEVAWGVCRQCGRRFIV